MTLSLKYLRSVSRFIARERELCALACAFWPVWAWYFQRMVDGSDEPLGLLALMTVVAFVVSQRGRTPSITKKVSVPFVCVALSVFLISTFYFPMLLQAAIATVAIGYVLVLRFFSGRHVLAFYALLLLSLPLIASLQFYVGYPLRFVTAECAAALLRVFGTPVVAEGTVLQWMAERVSIDAPCSGVKMLWSALYVAFSGALFFRLSAFGTWLSYVFASFLVFLGNVLRSTILFYTESGLVIAPSWIHQAVGAALLVIVCGLVLIVTKEVSFRWQLA